jgi:hypothetical protein
VGFNYTCSRLDELVRTALEERPNWSGSDFYDRDAQTSDQGAAAAYHFGRFMEALGLRVVHDPHLEAAPIGVRSMCK